MSDQPDPRTKMTSEESRTAAVVGEFLKEVLILLIGLALGFFWYMYYTYDNKSVDVHIIIFLLVIIICMARYIVLFKRNRPSD